jgi:nucleotide-binding universal stress UspA family protein
VEGRPNEVIASLARDRGADVVALGAGPRSLIVGRFLGSVATDLLHGPMPLLIAREAPTADRVRVVVGTDGSGHADRAIGLASQFLDPERCDVTIVSVAVLDHRGPGGALRRLCDLRTERGDPGQGHRTRMGVRRAGRDDHAGPPL